MKDIRRMVLMDPRMCGDTLRKKLERMARKGWKLRDIDINGVFVFEAIEPQPLYYCVDIFEYGYDDDLRVTGRAEDYVSCCQAAGWELAAMLGRVYIFVTGDPGAVPIQTESKLLVNGIRKALGRDLLVCGVYELLMTVLLVFAFLEPPGRTSAWVCVLTAALWIPLAVILLRWLIWDLVNRYRITKGKAPWLRGYLNISSVIRYCPFLVLLAAGCQELSFFDPAHVTHWNVWRARFRVLICLIAPFHGRLYRMGSEWQHSLFD